MNSQPAGPAACRTPPLARQRRWLAVLLLPLLAGPTVDLPAAPKSDVRNSLHNLSSTAPTDPGVSRNVVSSGSNPTDKICVFCHTPHGTSTTPIVPLWNRQTEAATPQTYDTYDSASIDATDIAAEPSNRSKLCLSCHDGTIALGAVDNAPGSGAGSEITLNSATDVRMPGGTYGVASGYTRHLGGSDPGTVDLTNDHPISFTYDDTLAGVDGELLSPSTAAHIANRVPNTQPHLPLYEGKVECSTCHDPHRVDPDATVSIKFLRGNRFQKANPTGASYSENSDIICLGCHDKAGWETSAHALQTTAGETYTAAAVVPREFPVGIAVWQAACLNCHDTHTVQGARRLLREGVDGSGDPALEETCFQCHTGSGSILSATGNDVPDIEADYTLANGKRMPLTSTAQKAGSEVHAISSAVADTYVNCVSGADEHCGADFVEPQALLGNDGTAAALNNRHAECTDCHNPHRVMKSPCFNGGDTAGCATGGTAYLSDATASPGTHRHTAGHTNVASGVLAGAWGVEPKWGDSTPSFYDTPETFEVRRGYAGVSTTLAAADTAGHLTREYQVCLKCHSNYGYPDDDLTTTNWNSQTATSKRPSLDGTGLTGSNPTDQSNFNFYTNQAREFATSTGTGGDTGAANTGADSDNHRSWHPVMGPTGRTYSNATRRNSNWEAPWDAQADIGTQTMYCTDCHGAATSGNGDSGEGDEGGNNFGPHGSTNRFLLKGDWNNSTNAICYKCHDSGFYDGNGSSGSAFNGDGGTASHAYHRSQIGSLQCNWCHVAVPHGWKNRSFLVNLRDVGPEAGLNPGTEISNNSLPYTRGPYYMRAYLKINSFPSPGGWSENNCLGKDWMTDNCVN